MATGLRGLDGAAVKTAEIRKIEAEYRAEGHEPLTDRLRRECALRADSGAGLGYFYVEEIVALLDRLRDAEEEVLTYESRQTRTAT